LGPGDPPAAGPSPGPPLLGPGRWVLPGSPSRPLAPRERRRPHQSRTLATSRFIVAPIPRACPPPYPAGGLSM